ncbi:MAG: ABC transporter permease [Anaerolineales bacterium]|nr:ABC transporter permease [Anaerolineales bacterium]
MTNTIPEEPTSKSTLSQLSNSEGITTPQAQSPARLVLRRLFRNKLAIVGLAIIGTVVLTAIFAPVLAKQTPDKNGIFKTYLRETKIPPSLEHPMGTDDLGRDMLSLIIYGSRISIRIGFFSVGLAIIIGVILGALSGYFGGAVDNIIMRLMDIMLAFPSILLALVIVAVIGPGLLNAMIAVGIVSIPTYARITRASVISERSREYVQASRALGANSFRLLMQHILPNALSPIIVAGSLGIATAILDAAGLGFLGLGAQPPTPEWGLLLSRNKTHIFTSPWMVIFPGISIMFLVLGFNLIGDGLRDALDPRLSNVGLKAPKT